MTTTAKPQLKIAAHVVIQLGQELVTDVEQAFLELAKNAYDADSHTCDIFIDSDWEVKPGSREYKLLDPSLRDGKGRDGKVGRVLIVDKGVGADSAGVTDGWLTISASLKRSAGVRKPKTKLERTPVGDKGLGRLATMKIGDLLLFRTSKEGERIERVTAFSWSQFSKVRTIDEITVDQWTAPKKPPYAQGSTVEIIGLHERTRWQSETEVRKLAARLSQLVNPYKSFADFDIHIHRGPKVLELLKVGADVLNFAAAKFTFHWDGAELHKQAFISTSLFRGTIGEEAKSKFETIFASKNQPALKQRFKDSKRLSRRGINIDRPLRGWLMQFAEDDDAKDLDLKIAEVACGPFRGEIYYFMFNEDSRNKIQGSSSSVEHVQEMAGLQVFRDGFRVRVDDDWLGLSSGTTSGNFYNLRPANTLGYFAVTNEDNPGLIEKSDREGFVDNPAHQQFMEISQACKAYANEILYGVRQEMNGFYDSLSLNTDVVATPRQAQAKINATRKHTEQEMLRINDATSKAIEKVERTKSLLQKSVGSNPAAKAAMKEVDQALLAFTELGAGISEVQTRVAEMDRATDVIESFRKGESDRNTRLLESASVGLSARVLSHELLSYVDNLETGIRDIGSQTKQLRIAEVDDALRLLSTTVRELRKAISSLNPLLPGAKALKDTLVLGEIMSNYADVRGSMLKSKGIDIKLEGGDTATRFKFSRPRFYQILENLLQNSVYWLGRQREQDPKAPSWIRISINDDGFSWSDSGPGVHPRYEESLFEAFVTSKRASEGQGLGLYICSTYLEAERCSISLSPVRNKQGNRYRFKVDLSGAKTDK